MLQRLIYNTQMLQNPLIGLLPEDQANLILIMLVSIPLSYLFSFVYNKYILLALTMTLTMGFQSLLFPDQKWFLWGQQQLVFLIIRLAPRRMVGHIVIVESFLALSAVQLRRLSMTYGENSMDVTAIFMMQLFNYIGLGYNYQNGALPEEKLSADQIQRRVVEPPNYLTYLGFVNFLPACLVGPSYEYTDFDNYLHRRGDYASIPNTLIAMFKESGVFFLALALYFGLSYFNIDRTVTPQFDDYNYAYKIIYTMFCITHIELKYVTAWSLAMISMRASGITYNPIQNTTNKDNSISYNFARIEMNNMDKFYLDPSFKVKADHWNICTVVALRRYIYENIYNPKDFTDEKKKRRRQFHAQLGTVIVSALWHGLYPGYYISFVHWILNMQITQEIFRLRRVEGSIVHTLYSKYEKLMDGIQNFYSHFCLTYYGMPFHLMTWGRVWTYLRYTYFLPYILLYISFYLITVKNVLGGKKKRGEKKEEAKRE